MDKISSQNAALKNTLYQSNFIEKWFPIFDYIEVYHIRITGKSMLPLLFISFSELLYFYVDSENLSENYMVVSLWPILYICSNVKNKNVILKNEDCSLVLQSCKFNKTLKLPGQFGSVLMSFWISLQQARTSLLVAYQCSVSSSLLWHVMEDFVIMSKYGHLNLLEFVSSTIQGFILGPKQFTLVLSLLFIFTTICEVG